MSAKIMAWNVQNFGQDKGNNNAIVECIARTIINNEIDIFVIVELIHPSALNNLTTKLKQLTNKKRFFGYYSPRSYTKGFYTDTLQTTPHSEFYGFIFNDQFSHQPLGYSTLIAKPHYYVNEGIDRKSLQKLKAPTKNAGDGYQNSFYLYNQKFPSGRPPCWAVYKDTDYVDLVVVHLRPDENMIRGQVRDLLKFDIVQDESVPLIVLGDFNTQSEEILSRNAVDIDNFNEMIADNFKGMKLFPVFTRTADTGTHVSGHIYDNIYLRAGFSTSSNDKGIVTPDVVLTSLYQTPNAESDLKKYMRGRFPKTNKVRTKAIENYFRNPGQVTKEDSQLLYTIISDHYPIWIQAKLQ